LRRATGVDISEIIRDLVERWAREQVHGATVLSACMKAKGITAADAGISGKIVDALDWGED